jgi:hypothetical protein
MDSGYNLRQNPTQAGPSKSQIAANELARMAAARDTKKEAMRQQLQQNPQLLQQLQTVVKTQEDIDILTELLGEMNMNRGGRRRRRTNKRRRTFRKKRSTKRRR